MGMEGFFEAVVGSREGEFTPSLEEVPEKELMAAFEESEKESKEKELIKKVSESSLEKALVKEKIELSSGANKTVWLIFTNGESGIFKPLKGEARDLREHIDGTLYKRERAAYIVDQFLGFDLVPDTVIREIDGEVGSL